MPRVVEQFLWTEKYRPKKIDDYVFKNNEYKDFVNKIVSEQQLPNLLMFGPAGTGKSSLINVLLHELDVEPSDIMRKNCSSSTGIDTVRDEIQSFVSTYPFGKFKVVVCEEFEQLSMNAQNALKLIIEDYAHHARFLLTTNNKNRIIPPILSRMQELLIDTLDMESYILNAAKILTMENITFDADLLLKYSQLYYPDMRKFIGALQKNSINGVLIDCLETESSTDEFEIEIAKMIKHRKIEEARALACSKLSSQTVEEFYTYLYKNLYLWSDNKDKQAEALLIIRDGLYKNAIVANWEINLAGTLIELGKL